MNEYALRIDANLLAIREFGPWLRHIVDGLGPDADPALASTLELSIHELLVNIVEHAYRCAGGVIEIDAHLEHDSIRFEIHDAGNGFDIARVSTPDPANPTVRGYGLMIIRQLASTVEYCRVGGRNHWTVVFPTTVNIIDLKQ